MAKKPRKKRPPHIKAIPDNVADEIYSLRINNPRLKMGEIAAEINNKHGLDISFRDVSGIVMKWEARKTQAMRDIIIEKVRPFVVSDPAMFQSTKKMLYNAIIDQYNKLLAGGSTAQNIAKLANELRGHIETNLRIAGSFSDEPTGQDTISSASIDKLVEKLQQLPPKNENG